MKNPTQNPKGKFQVDYATAISGFSNTIRKFPLKKILYKSLFRGKGLEFESYRNFEPGDDASMIDWKASLRGDKLLAKKYIEERDLNVYFLVDVSSSMLFGSGDKLKAEYAAECCAALGHLILESGDNVGLIMFHEKIEKYIPAKSGRNQFNLIFKTLADPEEYGGNFDLEKAVKFALDFIKTDYNVIVIVSDFIGLKKNAKKSLKLLTSRFETLGIMTRDLMDENLPKLSYQFSISDPYSGRRMVLDPKMAADIYKKSAIKQKEGVRDLFRDCDIDILELNLGETFYSPLANFLRSRSKGEI